MIESDSDDRAGWDELSRLLAMRQSARIEEFLRRFTLAQQRTIEANAIPPASLYVMYLRFTNEANPKSSTLDGYRNDSQQIAKFAKDLRSAAYGLRFVCNLKLPFIGGAVVDDPFRGGDGVVAADADLPSLPLPSGTKSAFSSRIVHVFDLPFSVAEDSGAEWKSPFQIPGWFLAQFSASRALAEMRTTLVDEPRLLSHVDPDMGSLERGGHATFEEVQKLISGFAPQDRDCDFLDLQNLAALLDDLAGQFELVARKLRRGRGRPIAQIERAFRSEFSELARRHACQYLDALGAELFSLTFQQVTADVYQRAREKDVEAARKGGKRTRQKSAKSG